MEGYIVLKYKHGEVQFLTHMVTDLRYPEVTSTWSTNMSKAELFNLEEVFTICDTVLGSAVKRIKFN